MAQRPIGVFGGTFDPVHLGHLRAALELLEGLALAEVRFIPASIPPHRGTPGVSAERRLALLERAVAGQPGFVVDDRELTRDGKSYTVDTLASLRDELGETPLCLLLGMDAFLGLPEWHRWRELLDYAHIVVAHRPGWSMPGGGDGLGRLVAECRVEESEALAVRPAGAICFRRVTPLDISATRIRSLIASGRSPRYLLPERVWEAIESEEDYRAHAG